MKLYLENKITKDDVAKIYESTPDYVAWLIEKWKTNPDFQKMQNEINENNSKNIE